MERLIPVGKLKAKSSAEVGFSKVGIGFEKLDRAVFDPAKAYDLVGKLGVKPVRLQSGWARTESAKGIYDFSWLDSIVDNLRERGLEPWICLCYGNALYTEAAKTVFGAVGCPPIFTEEEKAAWRNYVTAVTKHFKGRVTMWEIWNEPDGNWCWKHGASGKEYAAFAIETAAAIRAGNPDAYVIGGSICIRSIGFLTDALEAGLGDVIDGLTFHEYTAHEESVFERVQVLSSLVHMYNPRVEIIQGESGSQSRSDGAGALRGGAWTPEKQAKQLLRHGVIDLLADVKFSSYFTTVDMIEALNGTVGDKASYLDYGYFGVLGADFDENGIACGTYTPKPSYYALQNFASLMADSVVHTSLPVLQASSMSPRIFHGDFGGREMISGSFLRRDNGAKAFAYWTPTDLMTTTFCSTASFEVGGRDIDLSDISLVDPMSGNVYALPDSILECPEDRAIAVLRHLPIMDYPLFVTFGRFADLA